MPPSDNFFFTINFGELPPKRLKALCQLDEAAVLTAETWVSATRKLTNELYSYLKPAGVTELKSETDKPYVITVYVPYSHAVMAQNLLAKYMRTRKLHL